MSKISANDNMYLLLLMVFMGASSMVVAVDITFYRDVNSCTGLGVGFSEVLPFSCCTSTFRGSVEFTDMEYCDMNHAFEGEYCRGNLIAGLGNLCRSTASGLRSARWGPWCEPRIADVESKMSKCEGKAKPTSIVFTEDAHKGSWMLNVPDADEVFSQLERLSDGEKVNWLKTEGAVFYPSIAGMKANI